MKRVLVTGCSGFVGQHVCMALRHSGYIIRGAVRARSGVVPDLAERVDVGDIRRDTNWEDALQGIDAIMHLAARAHVFDSSLAAGEACMEVNARGTRRLIEAAVSAGVRRFVYLSSVKVNGEETRERPFGPDDAPAPQDAYGRSKWMAEQAVVDGARMSSMETVIVRSPLVYGPGVRGNFAQMMRWVHRGWPLPLGGVRNLRSLVSVWNLADLLARTLEHPAGAGTGTFMVSDGVDLSTPELLRLIGRALGRQARLVRAPVSLLRMAASVVGAEPQISKLCGSLQVDISETRRGLQWAPPLPMEEAMARTAAAYLTSRAHP